MAKIAVLGYGTVGSGVVEVLETNKNSIEKRAGEGIEVKYVLDLRDFPGDPVQEKIVHDVDIIIQDKEIDVVVEVMGGIEPAFTFAKKALDEKEKIEGIHGFWHKNIFEAVYCTNLLMRSCDVLVTKPSELAFYPVPKLFIRRVGKHEMWGAIHSAEVGDGTLECRDIPHTIQMLEIFLQDDTFLSDMCQNIVTNKKSGLYDGAYKVVELAMGLKNKQK